MDRDRSVTADNYKRCVRFGSCRLHRLLTYYTRLEWEIPGEGNQVEWLWNVPGVVG